MSTFLSCYDCESPSTKGSFPSSGESKLEIDNEGREFPGQNHDDLGQLTEGLRILCWKKTMSLFAVFAPSVLEYKIAKAYE